MSILGINSVQSEIVKRTQLGESYRDIANSLGVEEYYVIKQEMIALDILAERWNEKESEVKNKIKSMFLILLCLLLSYDNFMRNISMYSDSDNGMFNRVTRTGRGGRTVIMDTLRAGRGGRRGRGGRKSKDSGDHDSDEHDLFEMIDFSDGEQPC